MMFIGKPANLSNRQWRVLSLAILGFKQTEISAQLQLTLSMVKKECVQICARVSARNLKHAVAKSVRLDDFLLHEDLRNPNDLYQEMLAKPYFRMKNRMSAMDVRP